MVRYSLPKSEKMVSSIIQQKQGIYKNHKIIFSKPKDNKQAIDTKDDLQKQICVVYKKSQ